MNEVFAAGLAAGTAIGFITAIAIVILLRIVVNVVPSITVVGDRPPVDTSPSRPLPPSTRCIMESGSMPSGRKEPPECGYRPSAPPASRVPPTGGSGVTRIEKVVHVNVNVNKGTDEFADKVCEKIVNEIKRVGVDV